MSSLARRRIVPRAAHDLAKVVAADASHITVQTAQGETLRAKRAASCLVPPAAGDEVSVFAPGDGRAFITAILVRSEGQGVDIEVEGDLRIRANGAMSLASKTIAVSAEQGSFVLSRLTVLAGSLLASGGAVQLAVTTVDAVVDRLSQTVNRCYRTVRELDHLRAERIDYRAEQEMCLRSENFLVGARQLAKLDAEQIHIG